MASRILAPALRPSHALRAARLPARPLRPTPRAYSTPPGRTPPGRTPPGRTPSRHAQIYSDFVPGMIPVFLLGSAVFLGAKLLQASLAHEKWLEAAEARVRELEAQVDALRAAPGHTDAAETAAGNGGGGGRAWWRVW